MCIGVFCSLQLFHSLKRPFHRYNSPLLRIPILRTEPVILLALHNADLAHRVHAAACPIAKLTHGVWFIVCSTGLATERGPNRVFAKPYNILLPRYNQNSI